MNDVLGPDTTRDLVSLIQTGLDELFPSQSPWKIIDEEQLQDGRKGEPPSLSSDAQNRETPTCPLGSRTSMGSGPLSIVLHVNDGLSTYLPGPPCDVFSVIRKNCKANPTLATRKKMAKTLEAFLDKYEKQEFKPPKRSRAGQCLVFQTPRWNIFGWNS